MQASTGSGSAGSGDDREIVAFHPGTGYYMAQDSGGPLDGWKDAQYSKPEVGQLVSGWTGRVICQCVYDYTRKIWVTNEGTPIKVLIWKLEQ